MSEPYRTVPLSSTLWEPISATITPTAVYVEVYADHRITPSLAASRVLIRLIYYDVNSR